MPTLKDIRVRIKGVKSTQQVTKAMKMVAAAKLRRAQERAVMARPYAKKLKEMLGSLSAKVDTSLNPMLSGRSEVNKVLVIVITADRGLCGAFNTNAIKLASKIIHEDYPAIHSKGGVSLICAGSRGFDFFRKREYKIVKGYSAVFQHLDFSTAKEIADIASGMYLRGEVDRVVVAYNEFKSVLAPNLREEVILPIAPEIPGKESSSDYIYEPSPSAIIDVLVPKHHSPYLRIKMLG
ncbi:MAG: ATP synthase F1 subunit gamma, partial [Chlorobiaceae bacterium]|nr:ATP synthase F1 subunit gamma [Chlorobiaceae bacterium]